TIFSGDQTIVGAKRADGIVSLCVKGRSAWPAGVPGSRFERSKVDEPGPRQRLAIESQTTGDRNRLRLVARAASREGYEQQSNPSEPASATGNRRLSEFRVVERRINHLCLFSFRMVGPHGR